MMDLRELKKNLDDAHVEIKGLIDRQSAEIKEFGETTTETAKAFKAAEKKFDDLNADLDERVKKMEKRAGDSEHGAAQIKSAGQLFIESEQFKSAVQNGNASVDPVMFKDITSAANSAGALAMSQRSGVIARDPFDRAQFIRSLMNVQQTQSGSIDYFVDHTGFTNSAGAQTSELQAKSKSELVLEEKTTGVKTIAHYVIASRQVLSDAAMLRGYIDGRLRYGLLLEEDRQILYGDGTGGTLTGLFNSGIQDHGDMPAGVDRLTHIRRAMVKARLSEYPVDGIALSPADWAEIELTKNDTGDYIWAWYMASNGQARVWRVPVVETTAIESGDFILGNWSMGATLWDREQANIRVSDSHADLFVKNGVAILGEERLALTVERPSAFVKGTFNELVDEGDGGGEG